MADRPPFDSSLIRVIAGLLKPAAPLPYLPLAIADHQAFTYVARYWHIAPSLWLKLRDCPDIPTTIRESLRHEYWDNVNRNAHLREAAIDIISILNGEGIVPVILKGGCQLFDPPAGNAGTRVMVDLDILAPPGTDRLAFETLIRHGFVTSECSEYPDPATGHSSHHWPELIRPDDKLAVEIHHTPWVGGGLSETQALIAAAVAVPNIPGHVLLPCTTHRLLHNAVHGFRESPFGYVAVWDSDELDTAIGCVDLRQLLDFAELCALRGTDLDWRTLLAEAERFGHKADLQQWAFLAHELFATTVAPEAAVWHVDRPELRSAWARSRALGKTILRRVHLLDTVREWKARLRH